MLPLGFFRKPEHSKCQCPIPFDGSEAGVAIDAAMKQEEADAQFEILRNFIGISVDGWVTHEGYNNAVAAIGRALTVRERIDLFCRRHKPDKATPGLRKDILTAAHWQQLDKIHDCLKTFEVATLATPESRPFFYQWFQTLVWLPHEIDNWRVQFEEDAASDVTFKLLSDCCTAAWQKCEKYYRMADQTPIVYAAIILDPREKRQWFIDEWGEGTPE